MRTGPTYQWAFHFSPNDFKVSRLILLSLVVFCVWTLSNESKCLQNISSIQTESYGVADNLDRSKRIHEFEYFSFPINPYYVEEYNQQAYAVSCRVTILFNDEDENGGSSHHIEPLPTLSALDHLVLPNDVDVDQLEVGNTKNFESDTFMINTLQSIADNTKHKLLIRNSVEGVFSVSPVDGIDVPVCIQTSSYMGAVVYKETVTTKRLSTVSSIHSTNKFLLDELPAPDSAEIYLKDLLDTKRSNLSTSNMYDMDKWQINKTASLSYQLIPCTNVHLPGFYKPSTNKFDNDRSFDSNRGNFMWNFGSTRMINPITVRLYDRFFDFTSTAEQQYIKENHLERYFRASVLVIATANLFHLNLKRPLTKYVYQLQEQVKLYPRTIPVIVLGLGIQYLFEKGGHGNTFDLDGVVLEDFQIEFLRDIALHETGENIAGSTSNAMYPVQIDIAPQRNQTNKMIGVRGDITERICVNSGINNCVSMGCPSFTISRDLNLGKTLQAKWDALKERLSMPLARGIDSNNKLNIKVGMTVTAGNFHENDHSDIYHLLSSLNDNYNATVFGQVRSDIKNIDEAFMAINPGSNRSSLRSVVFNNTETWIQYIKDSKFDLCVSPRIHGAMAFIAAGVPALIIPTDPRILELVQAMKLPYISLHDVVQMVQSAKYSNEMNQGQKQLDLPSALSIEMLLSKAVNTNFTEFEINRRLKLQSWKTMLEQTGLSMDPALVRIINAPL